MSIEDDISNVDRRVDKLEERFDRLKQLLLAGLGCDEADRVVVLEAQVERLQKESANWQQSSVEYNSLFLELSKILKVRGKITKPALLNAAKRAMGPASDRLNAPGENHET
jgi:hypothetical protein